MERRINHGRRPACLLIVFVDFRSLPQQEQSFGLIENLAETTNLASTADCHLAGTF